MPTRTIPAVRRIAWTTHRVQFAAKAAGSPRIEIVGYTGEPMRICGWESPVIVDLTSLWVPPVIPILYDHIADTDFVIGQADRARVEAGRLLISGVALGVSQRAKQVLALALAGFAWQASVGADPAEVIRVPRGETIDVNGRTYRGPVVVGRNCTLREISMVVLGGDGNTSATVGARGLPSRKPVPKLLPTTSHKARVAAAAHIRHDIATGKYKAATPRQLATIRSYADRLARVKR